jgi:hypothetical protein
MLVRPKIRKGLMKARWGGLAKFPLLDDVVIVWMDGANASRERALGDQLVWLIKDGNASGLRAVAKIVKVLLAMEHGSDDGELRLPVIDHQRDIVVRFFRRLTGERWTPNEIQKRLELREGVHLDRNTLKRWCQEHGFPVKPDVRGRRKGT